MSANDSRIGSWGRWGAEDQLGALNQVTAEHVVKAAALREGVHAAVEIVDQR